MFASESFWWNMSGEREIGKGHFETLALSGTGTKIDSYFVPVMQHWRVYHFHDTSDSAYVKQLQVLAFGLILPLGSQNVFVFTQGAIQPRLLNALPVAIVASLSDTLLILLAIFGVSVVVLTWLYGLVCT